MSSKILTPGPSGEQPPRLVFHRIGSVPTPPDSGLPATAHEQDIHELLDRVRGLEQESELRAKEAYEVGYREGESAAAQRTAAEIEAVMAGAARSVADLTNLRQQMQRQMEEDLVRLAVLVARRILHRELSVDPEALTGVVRAAVEKTNASQVQVLRAAPADAGLIERLLPSLALPEKVVIRPDASLPRGSVIFETSRGIYDSSVHTQLEEIERGFVDLVRRQTG